MTKNEKTVLGQLKKKKRDELLFIMEQLLERKPDIIPTVELLIEFSPSALSQQEKPSNKSKKPALDLSKIQARLNTIVQKASRRGRESIYWVVEELGHLCEIGDNFADAEQWANAQAVYVTIIRETIIHYEELEDECQISEVIDGCTHALVLCLDTQRELPENEQLDASSRQELLACLFNIWGFEHNYGGINVDVVDAIIRNVKDNERKMVEEWIQQKIDLDPSKQWRNKNALSFLTKLTGGTPSSNDQEV